MLTVQALTWDIRNACLLVKRGIQSSFSDLCQHPALSARLLSPHVAGAGYVRLVKLNFDGGSLDLTPHRTRFFKFVKRFTN